MTRLKSSSTMQDHGAQIEQSENLELIRVTPVAWWYLAALRGTSYFLPKSCAIQANVMLHTVYISIYIYISVYMYKIV